MDTSNKIIKLLLIISALFFSSTSWSSNYGEIGLPVTEVYDTFSHKGATQNWWLAQAKNGLIYNGTGTGLNEWDGENWAIYKTPQKSRIRSIAIWKDDNIYIGTSNDIGFFHPNKSGSLTYQSLLKEWSFEEKQFGEVWSTAANKDGVMFLSNKYLLFWNGKSLEKIDTLVGTHRIFNIDDTFYFKANNNEFLYRISTTPKITVKQTKLKFEKEITIRKILKNNDNNLVFITAKHGIYERVNDQLVHRLSMLEFPEDSHIYNGIQASDGYYYLTTLYDGLFIVSEDFQFLKHYSDEHGLGTNTLLSIMEDIQGTIWISGAPNIIKMIPPHVYSHYITESNSKDTEEITNIRGKVTTLGDSVHQLQLGDPLTKPAFFKHLPPKRNSTWGAIEYQNHLIYAGANGVFAMEFDQNNELSNHHNIVKTRFAKSFAIDDTSNTLFATADEGLFVINRVNDSWQVNKVTGLEDELHNIAIENGVVWSGTSTQELYRIENAQYQDKKTSITKFIDKDGLGENNVVPYATSLGVVFGTNDGLMDFKNNRQPQLQFIKHLPEIFHTKGKDVYRLFQSKPNELWYRIGNHTGYIKKEVNNRWSSHENLFKHFPDSGYKGFTKTSDEILWFSMANGDIFRADIERIEQLPIQAKINIRKIDNLDTGKEFFGGIGNAELPILTQQSNSIRIHFALADNSILNAVKSNEVSYRHRLIGSGYEKYSPWSNENHKDFTLLQGGEYQFEVEAKDAWGRISNQKFDYTVLPPWYLSKTAWIVYGVIALLLIIISSWLTQKWRTAKLNQRNEELEQQVKQRTADVQEKANQLKQQQKLKDRFFTNVSHEFRTPLTLTIAPLESAISDHPEMDKSLLHPIKTALRNSKKMLSLVGEVLDINRLESGRFPLHVAQYNLSDLIITTVNRLKPWAKQHNQRLVVNNVEEPHLAYYDLDQIEKCLSNLISNAIKYSGENTRIEVSVISKNGETGVSVKDNGKGISKEFEDKIFQRFTQDESSEQITEPGTGIGLALVKELMELHHGRVELINVPNKGCQFITWLQNGQQHFQESQLIEPIERQSKTNDENSITIANPQIKTSNKHKSKDQTTILVVDDNQELREFITTRLSSYYKIIQASNGKEGYDIAQVRLPDLIISDVMMPIMDGLKMTEKLRNSQQTKIIPIILLTAKSSKRDTVTGLQSGADDYLTKPFDTSELIVRANGLICKRKLIRETIQSELSQQVTHLDNTSKFIDKLRAEILSQLSEPSLSVESLAMKLAMSRSSLNRKCKGEIDVTVKQYITDIRMQHALNLLKLKQYTISEIAYGTGYDSLSYFSRIFKKYYNKTPSEVSQAS